MCPSLPIRLHDDHLPSVRWTKTEGDEVTIREHIGEIVTTQAILHTTSQTKLHSLQNSIEILAAQAGVLKRLHTVDGGSVKMSQVLYEIETPGNS